MPNSIIAEGKTTNEAIENGLKKLNAKKEDVIINVLGNEEKRSFFNILEPTKIKVELILREKKIKGKEDTDELTEDELNIAYNTVKKFAEELVEKLKQHEIEIKDLEITKQKSGIEIKAYGNNLSKLIGYKGEVLSNIQLIFNNVANKNIKNKCKIFLDIGDYREKRKEKLIQLAQSKAKNVLKTKKNIELDPMNAYDRKIIHQELQKEEHLRNYSIGEEPKRRIVIEFKN